VKYLCTVRRNNFQWDTESLTGNLSRSFSLNDFYSFYSQMTLGACGLQMTPTLDDRHHFLHGQVDGGLCIAFKIVEIETYINRTEFVR
jgi:hypothetical protein